MKITEFPIKIRKPAPNYAEVLEKLLKAGLKNPTNSLVEEITNSKDRARLAQITASIKRLAAEKNVIDPKDAELSRRLIHEGMGSEGLFSKENIKERAENYFKNGEENQLNIHLRFMGYLGEELTQTQVDYAAHSLEHPSGWASMEAIVTLGKARENALRHADKIAGFLNENESALRQVAASSLGMIKSVNHVPQLIRALKDEHGAVRHAAAVALGNILDKRGLPALQKALKKETEGWVKKAIMESIKKF